MESIQKLLATPAWAYSACYVYPIMAVFAILFGIVAMGKLFMLPASIKQIIPMNFMVIVILIKILVSIFLALLSFWICRGALAPSKEKFANATTTTNKNPAEAPIIGQAPAVAGFDPEGFQL